MRPVGDFDTEVAFMLERLAWFDEVRDDSLDWWDEAGWAVVDEEVLRARSALQMLKDEGFQLPAEAIEMMEAADRQWRANPKAFDYMFRYALARREADELKGWVENDDGSTPTIPPSHWWWRPSKRW